jgi:hypothetical protein
MKNQHKRNAWISTAVLLAAAGAAHAGDRAASQSEQAAQPERFSIAIERVRPDRVVPQRQAIAVERVRPVRVVDVLATTAIAYSLDTGPSNDDPAPRPANRGLPFDRALLVPTGSRWADEQEAQKISQPLTAATSGTSITGAIPMQPVGSMTATPVVVTTTTSVPQTETTRTEQVAVVDTASKECSSVYASATTGHVCDAVETPSVVASTVGQSMDHAVGQMVVIPMQPIGEAPVIESPQVRTTPVIRIASELLPPMDSPRPISSPQGWNLVATPLPTAEAVVVTAQPEAAADAWEMAPATETFVATPAPAPAPAVTTITSPTSLSQTGLSTTSVASASTTPASATPGQMVRVVTESELAETVQPDVATKLFAQAVPSQSIASPAQNEAASGVAAEVAELFASELPEPVRETVVASGIRQMTVVTSEDLMPKLEEVEWFVAHHSAQAKAAQAEVSQPETVVAEAASPVITAPATEVPFITAAETFEAPVVGTMQQMTVVSASPVDATEPSIFAQAEPVEEVMIATTPLETPAVETASVNAVETTIQTPTMTIVGTMEPVDSGSSAPVVSTPAVVTTTPSAMTVRTSVRSSEEARTDAVLATLRRQAVSEDIYEEAQRRLLLRREVSATPRMSEMTLIVGDTLGRQIARSAGYLE